MGRVFCRGDSRGGGGAGGWLFFCRGPREGGIVGTWVGAALRPSNTSPPRRRANARTSPPAGTTRPPRTPPRPRSRLYVAPGGHMTTTRYAPATVQVHDARPHVTDFGLDRSGFTLLRHASAVSDFRDPAQLDGVYGAEVAELVKQATGADDV